MKKLVECVPNFCEGQDQEKISRISNEIGKIPGVQLWDIHSGRDTNRTVITFAGDPEAVNEAAFQAIKTAAQLIDMTTHKGVHPRMGATDVCPLIPLRGTTMAECVDLSRMLARRVGDELEIPVYLYAASASKPDREKLEKIRKGEYESLAEKLRDPVWKPDFGPNRLNRRAGATVIGARNILIAFNVNLKTEDRLIAADIASRIRESGRIKRDPGGKVVRDEKGDRIRIPGKFKACKAVGWSLKEYGLAQISTNLVDYSLTPPHIVFGECVRLAEQKGIRVTGSEVVGLIPIEAMLMAGRFFSRKRDKTVVLSEAECLASAVDAMGLNDLYPFQLEKKIIEYRMSWD